MDTTSHQHPHTSGATMPRMAAIYDFIVGVLSMGREKRFRQAILQRANLSSGERVLDVGCGTGTLALMAKAVVGQDTEVVGRDATPEMIGRARKKAQKRNDDVSFDVGLIEDIQFPDESFDVVFSTFMMHHLPDNLKVRGLAEIRRVLKPGGRAFIVDFRRGGISLPNLVHHGQLPPDGAMLRLIDDANFKSIETGKMKIVNSAYWMGYK